MGSSTASRVHRARDGGAGLHSVAAARLVSDPTLDLLVLGHSHVHALVRAANGGVYANPGSWLDAPTYLRIDDDRIELMQWTGSAEGDRLDSLNRRTEESLAQS